MIGRTNVIFGSGGSSGGSGGVTTVDLPTCLKSISAQPANGKVTLALTYSDTDFVSGVEVRYKTDSYPTSPTDGNSIITEGAATSIEITGLTNGTTYYFRVYLYREIDGVKYYQTDETNAKISAMPSPVWIEGITPAEIGENYIVIADSGTFNLFTTGSVTAYLVGGGYNGGSANSDNESDYGGNGGYGGYVYSHVLSDVTNDTPIICTIGAIKGNTTLKIGNNTLTSSSGQRVTGGYGGRISSSNRASTEGKNGVLTPYGYVGSSGGGGGISINSTTPSYFGKDGGEGAGKGGTNSDGGPAINYGCGGGGGFNKAGLSSKSYKGGSGMQGCVILTW